MKYLGSSRAVTAVANGADYPSADARMSSLVDNSGALAYTTISSSKEKIRKVNWLPLLESHKGRR
jgi:hypothetical protein